MPPSLHPYSQNNQNQRIPDPIPTLQTKAITFFNFPLIFPQFSITNFNLRSLRVTPETSKQGLLPLKLQHYPSTCNLYSILNNFKISKKKKRKIQRQPTNHKTNPDKSKPLKTDIWNQIKRKTKP